LNFGIFNLRLLAKSPKKDLNGIKGLSLNKIEKMLSIAKKIVFTGFTTVKHIVRYHNTINYISTLNKNIDSILGGGVPTGSLTEIYGESKSGKTQFCHVLCVSAQVTSMGTRKIFKIIYIDTEGNFSPRRIIQIAESYNIHIDTVFENIFYAKAYNTEHQNRLLVSCATLAVYSNIKVIIVDSCTILYRTEFSGRGELYARQNLLGKFLRNLYRIANEFNIGVVLTNQVVAANLEGLNNIISLNSKAIGGNIMAHITNTRILLKKSSANSRVFKIISSSTLAEKETKFIINDRGFDVFQDFS